MTLKITHPFVSTLADDPGAAGAGEVLPSGWNAQHTVAGTVGPEIGGRTALTANANYYVSATGSDSHGGTNPSTDAWLTLQHAALYIGSNIDFAGFEVTVNIGAGTFTGFGAASTVGGGILFFKGAGSGSTTITAGPNDGVYNFGECVTVNFNTGTQFSINAVTIKVPAGNKGISIIAIGGNIVLGDPVAFTNDLAFNLSVSNSSSICFNINGTNFVTTGSGTVAVGAGTAGNLVNVINGGFFDDFMSWSLSGTPTFSQTVNVTNGFYEANGTFTGAATGQRFNVQADGCIFSSSGSGTLGINYFPGNSAGSVTPTGSYDFYPFVQSIAGDPTTSNIADSGAWEIVKNTNFGIVAPWWNNAGTIQQISRYKLAANTNFYVATGGSDSNPGTAGSPWLTLQHAYNTICSNFDFGGMTVTVNVGAGTFTGGLLGSTTWLGGGALNFTGAGSGSTTISPTGADAFFFSPGISLPGKITISGMTLKTTTSGDCINHNAFGTIATGSDLIFGACAGNHISARNYGSSIDATGFNYSISGNAVSHLVALDMGKANMSLITVTFLASVTFSGVFVQATRLSELAAFSTTFSLGGFTVTGQRYSVDMNSIIFTGSGGSATFFPGTVGGSVATGGQYN